jgi:hypothetical protein
MSDDAQWFLERLSAEMPVRIHSRETDAGGDPAWHRAFELWLTDGEHHWATHVIEDQDYCRHPTTQGGHCETCDDTGLRIRVRHTFRYPAKRALAALDQIVVPKGRPGYGTTLRTLADNAGYIGFTIVTLRAEYSYFWGANKARRWIAESLTEFRRVYREDAPSPALGKSQAQLDAEAPKIAA